MADADKKEEENTEERRIVAIMVKPKDGVDPESLYKKITETIKGEPESKVKWDEKCKIEDGKIYASFTIEIAGKYLL
jgi:hypothetical protein